MSRKMQNNTIYSRFSQWMKSQPDTVAVTEDGRSTTYRELDRMADAIMAQYGKLGLNETVLGPGAMIADFDPV